MNVSRILVAGMVVLLVVPRLVPAQEASDSTVFEEEVRQAEHERVHAALQGDVAKMDRLLAPDFANTTTRGEIRTKSETLALYGTGAMTMQGLELHQLSVRVYGNTAVVTGVQSWRETFKGEPRSGHARFIRVWVKREGRWRCVSMQATSMQRPPETKAPRYTAHQNELERQLIGTWRLVSIERDTAGKRTLPFGAHPVGQLIYDPSGHMAVEIIDPDRSAASMDPKLTVEKNGYTAYFGSYDVDETHHTVGHHVDGSFYPRLVGSTLRRTVTISGDALELTSDSTHLRWKRTATGSHSVRGASPDPDLR